MKLISKICLNLMLALMIASGANLVYGVNPLPVAGALMAGSLLIKQPAESHFAMALQVEIWKNDIINNLFKDNAFLNFAFNADAFVLQGKVVHIPSAGGKPNTVKNRTQLPAQVTKRSDVDITYALDEFTTDPVLIENAEQYELSYDKRQSVIGEHLEALNEVVAEEMIYNWNVSTGGDRSDKAHIIRTDGLPEGDSEATPLTVAAGTVHDTATGTRLIFTKEKLKAAMTYMNKKNIAKANRYALLPSEFLDQLMNDASLKRRDSSMELEMRNGVITKLYGFNILERSTVSLYTNAATPVVKTPSAAEAATDNLAALCWQQNAVERAKGTVDFFEDEGNPTYYGDIYSGLIRMGGRIRRPEGVVAIVQAHGE